MTTQALVPLRESALTQPRELEPKQHPVAIFLSRHMSSARTLKTYEDELQALAELAGYQTAFAVPWHTWTPQEWHALLSVRACKVSPASLGKSRSVLAGLSRALWVAELIDAEKRLRIEDFPRHRFKRLPTGRSLSEAEVRALVRVCRADGGPAGARDGAILIGVGLGGGLRRAEVAGLKLENYNPAPPLGELQFTGKGEKERLVPLLSGARSWVDQWLQLRGPKPGRLFHSVGKAGRISAEGLTERSIWKVCAKRARQAGIERFSPHDLRRSYASLHLARGTDLPTVQALMGHSSPVTTANYDRRPEEARREAASLVSVPCARAA